MAKKIRIGELLIQNEIITTAQLEHALRVQRTRGRRLGRTLIELGYVEEDELLSFLAQQLEIPFIDLRLPDLSRDAVLKLPETHARRFRALVVEDTGNDYLVGMIDPMDIFAVDELSRILGKPLRLGVVRETDLVATSTVCIAAQRRSPAWPRSCTRISPPTRPGSNSLPFSTTRPMPRSCASSAHSSMMPSVPTLPISTSSPTTTYSASVSVSMEC